MKHFFQILERIGCSVSLRPFVVLSKFISIFNCRAASADNITWYVTVYIQFRFLIRNISITLGKS